MALEQSQARDRIEILVVDRASDDGSTSLDEEFPGVTLLRLPFDFGATKAMNIGTRTAKGEYLFFLSPNVDVEPGTIAALAERLDNDPVAVALCPLLVDAAGQPVPQVLPIPDKAFFQSAAERPPVRSTPHLDAGQETIDVAYPGREALLARRQFIAGMNYFDERLGHHWAEADLALQVSRAGKKIRICTAVRAQWHPPATSEPNDTAHQADRILGGAMLLGKYYGFFAGLTFKAGAALKALFTFQFGLFGALLSGQKLDGSGAG